MQIFRTLAGYSYGRADVVRRAMAKKKLSVLENERKAFLYGSKNDDGTVNCVGAVANGVDEKTANEIFDEMISFASYAFNKSHAAAYATLAYQTAYLKCHYLKEYMAALMTSVMLEGTDKLFEYCDDCEKSGIRILKIDINKSEAGFCVEEYGIRFALLAVKSLGRNAIERVLAERNSKGKFKNIFDFCERLAGKDINSRAVEALIKSGAFDSFPENRRQMMQNFEAVLSGASNTKRNEVEGQVDLFGDAQDDLATEYEIPYIEEYDRLTLLEYEKEALGLYVSGHPLDEYKYLSIASRHARLSEIIKYDDENGFSVKDNDKVSFVGMLRSKKLFNTKKGARMAFTVFEDSSAAVEVIVFPNLYEGLAQRLLNNAIFEIKGHISLKDDEEPKVVADEITAVENFANNCKKRTVCVKISSAEKEKIHNLKAFLDDKKGEGKLLVYLDDLKKLTTMKGYETFDVTEKNLSGLCSVAGMSNVAFKMSKV